MQIIPAKPEAAQLFLEGAQTLAEVEAAGIRVDTDYLDKTIKDYSTKIRDMELALKRDPVFKTWRRLYGDKSNLGSLPQMAKVIFGELGVPYPAEEKTRTGRWRTDEEVFEDVDLPFVREHIHLRKYKSMRARLRSLQRETIEGFFHPEFHLHTAQSYRGSSGSEREEERSGSFNFPKHTQAQPRNCFLSSACFYPPRG